MSSRWSPLRRLVVVLGMGGLGCGEDATAPSTPGQDGGSGASAGNAGGAAGSSGSSGSGGGAGEAGSGDGVGGTGVGGTGATGGTATGGGAGVGGTAGTAGSAGSAGASGGSAGTGGTGSDRCPDIGLDPAAGTTYFVCDCGAGAAADCQPGDDANDGSRESPWRSYERARAAFSTLTAGDAIAFCRGGVFEVDSGAGSQWINSACRADEPCVVRDYAATDSAVNAERPHFKFQDRTGFALDDPGDAEHEEGYVFLNLMLSGTNTDAGFFFYNDIDDVLMCNLYIDAFEIGVHTAGSNPAIPPSNGRNERIILRSSVVKNCPGQGWLGGGDGSGVEYNIFENNGYGEAVFNHNVYLSGSSGTADRGLHAVGNDLYRSTFVAGQCQGVSLVVHGPHDDLLIEGNVVHEDVGAAGGGCWGIAVDTDGEQDPPEGFKNAIIQNNVVINVGNVAIGLNACADCTIQNNIVISEQAEFDTMGILVPVLERFSQDLQVDRVAVRNNTVLFTEPAGGTGITLEVEGSGHSVTSNAIYYSGNKNDFSCFSLGLGTSAYAAVDHNLCFSPQAAGAAWEKGSGTLSEWQQASAFDSNSLWTDPLFVSTTGAAADLTPSMESPLIGKGDPLRSSLLDRLGKIRGLMPSIGALEP